MKKYHKTRFVIEVLSEDPIPGFWDISQVIAEANDGAYIMTCDCKGVKELTPKQAANALYKAGSEPGFFNLDDDGKSLLDDDEEETEADSKE